MSLPLMEYEVRAAETGSLLHRVWGWTEDIGSEDGSVAAASAVVFPAGTVLRQRATFVPHDPPRCLAWEWSVVDSVGVLVASNQGRCVPMAFPFLGRALPSDAYPSYPPYALLGYVSTHLGLGRRKAASYQYLLMDTSLVQLDLWVEQREGVSVPAGDFDCYRVRLRPSVRSLFPNLPGLVAAFAAFFVPTPTLWITAAEPQVLVKFSGTIGPPGSPDAVVQLVRLGAQADEGGMGAAAPITARRK